jgi:hypothetical protein
MKTRAAILVTLMYLLVGVVTVVCADSDIMKDTKNHDHASDADDDKDRGKGHDKDDDDDKDRGKGHDKDDNDDKDRGKGHDKDDNDDKDRGKGHDKDDDNNKAQLIAERIELKDNMSVPGLVIRFHNMKQAWPKDVQDLKRFIKDQGYDFDMDAVKDFKITETSKEQYEMRFRSLSVGEHMDDKVEIRIVAPKTGKIYQGGYSLVNDKLQSKQDEILFEVDLSKTVRITIK